MRRYKPARKPRRPARPFRELLVQPTLGQQQSSAHREKYPSRALAAPVPFVRAKDLSVSNTKYTIAPAYNKGAYQVIPASDIQHIGR